MSAFDQINITVRELAAPIPIPSSSSSSSLKVEVDEVAIAKSILAFAEKAQTKKIESVFTMEPRPFKNFLKLIPEAEIVTAEYFGPMPESNWVIKNNADGLGGLIAGAFPASKDTYETVKNIIEILNCGVTMLVCMQLEYDPNATERSWKFGTAIRPYYDDVKLIVKHQKGYAGLNIENEVLLPTFTHCPIKDCDICADHIAYNLAKDLAYAIRNGEIIYLHCWGGHGRTGVIVCLVLHLLYGITGDEAIERCEFVHDIRKLRVNVSSPQTVTQKVQVRRIICKLLAGEEILPPTLTNVKTEEEAKAQEEVKDYLYSDKSKKYLQQSKL